MSAPGRGWGLPGGSVSTAVRVLAALAVAGLAGAGGGCDSPPPKPKQVEPIVRDVPEVLRGTVGSWAALQGHEPVLVSGYGLVVGLNNTGGGALPGPIEATMERELRRGGVGKGGAMGDTSLGNMTAKELLRDPRVAVVIVEGVVPPGAPRGWRFDVRVRTLPGSSVTSLEGGRLWTTDLRLGPVTPFGAMRTRKLGEGRGEVFINPFADPTGRDLSEALGSRAGELDRAAAAAAAGASDSEEGATPVDRAVGQPTDMARVLSGGEGAKAGGPAGDGSSGAETPTTARPDRGARPMPLASAAVATDGVTRTVGRVLGGGVVTDPMRMVINLDNPSHQRAILVTQAINNRFPIGRGDEGQIARGLSDSAIALRVPAAHFDRADEFIRLVQYLQIDQALPADYARRYAEELRQQPALADELSWCLQAIGKPAIPALQGLYESPEFLVRLAALRAGGRLGDPRATPFLRELAASGPTGRRVEAIGLLGGMGSDPQINRFLRELVNDPETEVRVAAYEALRERGDGTVEVIAVEDKFQLHVVRARDGLVYVTQQGKPRIVIFGDGLTLSDTALVSAWEDRLLVRADPPSTPGEPVRWRLYYRDFRTERVTQGVVRPGLKELVRYMGRNPSPSNPEPGLGMTYSEVVGALFEIQRQGGVDAAFAKEQDRFLARLARAADEIVLEERPERINQPRNELGSMMSPRGARVGLGAEERGDRSGDTKPTIVPIAPRPKKE